jgi:hypothetical protein
LISQNKAKGLLFYDEPLWLLIWKKKKKKKKTVCVWCALEVDRKKR